MEEMREAAMAYYANLSNNQRQWVQNFFRSIDANGDGIVSIQEFSNFVAQRGYYQHLPPKLFQLLDNNKDGSLDFWECVTFFYMLASGRLVICDGCRSYLWGFHFLCVTCYNKKERSYDLCCTCYRNKNFSHPHSYFLDNYALLRANPSKNQTTEAVVTSSSGWSYADTATTGFNIGAVDAFFTALEIANAANNAFNIGAIAVDAGCSIM